jgi:hypothetical protein
MIELVAIAKVVWKKARPATFFRARLTVNTDFTDQIMSRMLAKSPSMLQEGSPNATSKYDGSVIWLCIGPYHSCQLI